MPIFAHNVHKGCKRTRPGGTTPKSKLASVHNPVEQSMAEAGSFDILQSLFNWYDLNRDGRLSNKELKDSFRALESRFSAYPAFRALRRHADVNDDGFISGEELDALVEHATRLGYTIKTETRGRGSTGKPSPVSVHDPVEQSMPTFGRFYIGRITDLFKSVPFGGRLFRRCDYNGDDCLSKEEFKASFQTLKLSFPETRALGHAEGLISEEELDALVE